MSYKMFIFTASDGRVMLSDYCDIQHLNQIFEEVLARQNVAPSNDKITQEKKRK